jgi:hypothetical protein
VTDGSRRYLCFLGATPSAKNAKDTWELSGSTQRNDSSCRNEIWKKPFDSSGVFHHKLMLTPVLGRDMLLKLQSAATSRLDCHRYRNPDDDSGVV